MGTSPAHDRVFTGQEIAGFLLRASHDLRSQLRAIRAHSELLAKQPPTSADDPRLGFILQGATNLEELIEGLNGYALALRTDPAAFAPTPTGVLLRTALARLAKQPHKVAEVTYAEMPRVVGDPDRITQLFESLLRHRGQLATQLQVSASPEQGLWLFRFRDNGPALEPRDAERMFEPFIHGLGLAAAREIVERHGGKIRAESQDDGGCTVWFELPAG